MKRKMTYGDAIRQLAYAIECLEECGGPIGITVHRLPGRFNPESFEGSERSIVSWDEHILMLCFLAAMCDDDPKHYPPRR